MSVSLSALQENFITILAYDDTNCVTVRNLIAPEFWGGPYALISRRIYEYIDRYKKAPKDHIADLLADKLDGKNARESSLYEDILVSIRDQHELVNADYVMSQLETFIKRQSLRTIAVDLAKALQQDTDESLLEAEKLMATARSQQASVFDPGLRLSNKDRVLDFLDQQTACFPTGIPEFDKRGFGPTRKELWLYIAAAKRGKCIARGELVIGADGSYRPIEEFTGSVPSLNEKTFAFEKNKATLKPNGKKSTLRLTTRTGRSVRLTHNHPLLTPSGWVDAGKLCLGDKIAAPRILPVFGTKMMPTELVRFIGFILGDGGVSKELTITFTQKDEAILRLFEECANYLGCKISQAKGDPISYYVSSKTTFRNQAVAFLKLHGMMGTKSRNKIIPACIFTLKRLRVIEFLQALFACDGSIFDGKTGPEFEYCSTSEIMIRQIDHLLTRFGIVSKIRSKSQLVRGEPYVSWHLSVRGKRQIKLLRDEIGLLCEKGEKLNTLVEKYEGTSSRNSYMHGDRVGDIFWDEIKIIEEAGVVETYDLAVENNHNFIAGNIVVHNTWMLIQLAKMSMIHRLRVCHITLEMSEDRSAQRYLQALFAMAKRKEKQAVTKFERDQLGRLVGFAEAEVTPKLSMQDPNIRTKLEKRITKFGPRLLDNVIIKQFPTGTLTTRQLESYLDNLESNERFVPDLLIVDYPDLMDVDKNNYRLSIDEIYKDLRGMGVTRNMAVAVVSQGNRSSEKAKNVGSDHVAEAWSKVAHADCIITYNQTIAEKKMGLARLYVAGGRNDEDRITLVVSQNYASGVFAVDSILMNGANYWPNLPKGGRDGEEDET